MKSPIVWILFVLQLALAPARADEQLVLNTGTLQPFSSPQQDGVFDLLYQELGKRLGITIRIQFLPAERALLNANAGIDDGDVCRIAGLEKQYTELLYVPEEVLHMKSVVFTKLHNFRVNGVKSLQPYHVGILLGRKNLEEKITGVNRLSKFASAEAMFTALEHELIDVAILEKSEGSALLKSHAGIKALQPPLLETSCYLYLNKKHSALVPLFAAELKKMKLDGRYKKIVHRGFQHYLNESEF